MKKYNEVKNVIVVENEVVSYVCETEKTAKELLETLENGVMKVCEVGFLNDGDWDILKDLTA